VPFLRRIWLLGNLFKKPRYNKTSSELLLFLTPYIVTTYEEGEVLSRPDIQKSREEIDMGILEKF
jgi:type II secretory pathway component GspD/PulD (secretin)